MNTQHIKNKINKNTRWIDGGPMVIIITSLIAIFTIGLGDESSENENNNEQQQQQNRISAYSVFNRGFQRLLGSVDADALLAQHVGGGIGLGGVAAGNFMMGGDGDGGGDGGMRIQHNVDDVDRQRAHRRRGGGGGGNDAAVVNGVDDDEDDNDDNDNNNNNGAGTTDGRGGARKSGKKARRRNLDQRRQNRQQREAAVALGVHLDDATTPEQMMEIQRLIEAQIAAENNNNNQGA